MVQIGIAGLKKKSSNSNDDYAEARNQNRGSTSHDEQAGELNVNDVQRLKDAPLRSCHGRCKGDPKSLARSW